MLCIFTQMSQIPLGQILRAEKLEKVSIILNIKTPKKMRGLSTYVIKSSLTIVDKLFNGKSCSEEGIVSVLYG
jgi:hypothetical protein